MDKSILNLYLQNNGMPLAEYIVDNPTGPSHKPTFSRVDIRIGNKIHSYTGNASNKKDIENQAAKYVYEILISRKNSDKINSTTGREFNSTKINSLIVENSFESKKPSSSRKEFIFQTDEEIEERISPSYSISSSLSQSQMYSDFSARNKSSSQLSNKILLLVDFDNSGRFCSKLENLVKNKNYKIVIFYNYTLNSSTLPKGNFEFIKAQTPVKEITDHNITFYCGINFDKIKEFSEIKILTKDIDLQATIEILKSYNLNAMMICEI